MARHIPDIHAIRPNVSFVIPYANFITNVTNVTNTANFNRLFSGKPYISIKSAPARSDRCHGAELSRSHSP